MTPAALLAERQDTRWWLTPDPHADQHRAQLAAAIKDWRDPRRELRNYRPTPEQVRQSAIEDAEWLVRSGASAREIARRLNTNPVALSRRLHRAGRHDLARHIEES